MDKGAHFYKCDFQVHTPRDINWVGDRPVSEEDRKTYADEFVRKCRELGINAVAITDHHDFWFYPYIKKAADNELDDLGNPIPEEEKLVVFPGLELTLSTPPCQAILIIDADYPINTLEHILHLLGITPNSSEEPTTVETVPITNTLVNGFQELYDKLNSIDLLKNRFIVFPNVSEGGRHTLLRAGNSEQYKKMPCVGGYVDGSLSQLGTGNYNIINGKAREWGFKSIAVFQTSDNRHRDFRLLGQYTTWVKWAEPTAEALRQACLAKESRLSQDVPELPQIFITQIDVTNSKFLGSFSIKFNRQYNAIIGGRGTGKSTILEYLRWGLCDEITSSYEEDQSDIEKRRKNFIEKTLIPFSGEVRITFNLNGINHIIKRNSVNNEIKLKIGDSDFELVTEEKIRKLLPIQAYSQKQLSSVGIRTKELKRFIEQPISNQLNQIKLKLFDNARKATKLYNDLIRKKQIQYELDQINLEIKSLTRQVENLRKSLTGVSEEDQKIIAKKSKYDAEENVLNKVKNEISITSEKINELLISFSKYPEEFPKDIEFENKELMQQIENVVLRKFEEIKGIAKTLQDALREENLKELKNLFIKWGNLKSKFEINYEAAKKRTSSNRSQVKEIKRLESRLQELSSSFNERNSILKEIGDPESEFEKFRKEWLQLHKEKIDLLNNQAQKFAQLSNGLIRADVSKGIDIHSIKDSLSIAFSKTRIREEKVQALCNYIIENDNQLYIWYEILNELRVLAELQFLEKKNIEIPEVIHLSRCSLTEVNIKKIIELFTPEKWISIAVSEIEFSPSFQYCTNNQLGDTIPFSEASAGQQATALLTVLLNQSGTPLIIDQPEDDIDNKAIGEIIDNIWTAKKKRQLIFSSHNANLVVNGDAELVICCDYRDTSSQTRGIIKAEGAIDSTIIRNEITSVMEGGEKAFRLRKEKYGF